MKRLLAICCFLFFTSTLFAQQFSQYNTGTLFDSFDNPAQRSFIPDSSKMYASNFFIPNFSGNLYLTGNAQQTLKNRYANNYYNNAALQIGGGNHINHVYGNADVYSIMFKMFTSLKGNTEIGFFTETKASGRAAFTDEDVALFNGSTDFPGSSYNNVFNSSYSYQVYNQFGVTYREQITKRLAFGIKIASVSGMYDQNIKIDQSHINFNKAADTASLALAGTNRKAGFSTLPFSNPGFSVSIGTIYKTAGGFIIQGNIKDLGFIHWNKKAETYDFQGETGVYDLALPNRETAVYNAITRGITGHGMVSAYTTPLDGRAELSASKWFWVDEDDGVKYSPTLIASKELFYDGFTVALVNPVSYKNYSLSVLTSIDDMRLFNFGMQFMVKSSNAEFFIGSDRLAQSISLVSAGLKNQKAVDESGAFTGGNITFGATFKFGPVIEHPMNASHIPMGDDDKGFLGKFWDKLFHPKKGTIQNN
jgi:hypothetical protein